MKSSAAKLLVATIVAAGVLAVAFTVTANITQRFSCFTSVCWRKADVVARPRLLPNVALQDAAGQLSNFQNLRGRVLVVNFIYTRCATICNTLGSVSSQLATRLASEIKQGKVAVISISFDPTRDNVANLQSYMLRLDKSQGLWQTARPTSESDNAALKKVFGVVTINDDFGGFDHNAALHIVDRTSHLVRIVELNDLDEAEKNVRQLL
ncbi:MAG: SCO family protein [Methylotenera sp.]